MNRILNNRRHILAAIVSGIGGAAAIGKAEAASLTPEATEGPFYPVDSMRMEDVDNDLVKVEGLVDKAGGEIILLKGMVSDRNGVPQDGLRIEIWQTDVNGKYLHSGDNRNLEYDKGFQGFGHDITDSSGNYIFRTIKPTQYPGRTPHIHVKICEGEKELLTTQFYIKDYPDNRKDGIFSRMSESEADSVSMIFSEDVDGTETIVNIVVKSW